MNEYDVVMFKEHHKWFGCLGFIEEINPSKIMVAVPVPKQGVAYIYCQEEDIEYTGSYPLRAIRSDEE